MKTYLGTKKASDFCGNVILYVKKDVEDLDKDLDHHDEEDLNRLIRDFAEENDVSEDWVGHEYTYIELLTAPSGEEWEIRNPGAIPCEVRRKGAHEWEECNWGAFCDNHGIEHDILA